VHTISKYISANLGGVCVEKRGLIPDDDTASADSDGGSDSDESDGA